MSLCVSRGRCQPGTLKDQVVFGAGFPESGPVFGGGSSNEDDGVCETAPPRFPVETCCFSGFSSPADAISRYETLLMRADHIPMPLGDTASAARSFMTGYGLASYDAVHAASAVAAGAGAIVTLDTGFALLPASLLAVYTDRSRLASCRRKRPR
ncbi:MAG: PIN domain-containing protein [Solirubrobacteraceae bacterium]